MNKHSYEKQRECFSRMFTEGSKGEKNSRFRADFN